MENEPHKDMSCCKTDCQKVAWWAILVVAVLAIPAIGIVVSSMSGARGFFQVSIFILACWICTYLGMRLMQNPKFRDKIDRK